MTTEPEPLHDDELNELTTVLAAAEEIFRARFRRLVPVVWDGPFTYDKGHFVFGPDKLKLNGGSVPLKLRIAAALRLDDLWARAEETEAETQKGVREAVQSARRFVEKRDR